MLAVVAFHAVAAYSTVTPHWHMHDGSSVVADIIRKVFDIFIMPIFFFVAGYFSLSSLQRKGVLPFLKGKFRRIGIPWLLAILIIVPLVGYKAVASKTNFLSYWLGYLKQAGTMRLVPIASEGLNQMDYWFLSLLFFFFFILSLIFPILKEKGMYHSTTPQTLSNRSILWELLFVGVLISVGYFVSMLFIPYSGWAAIDLLFFFQPTSLVLYIAWFVMGVYAYIKNWFVDGEPLGSVTVWAAITAFLVICFLSLSQGVFADPTNSHKLSPGFLLLFAFIRSFLCLAFLVFLTSYAIKYWNHRSLFNQKLASHSYNIYLVHLIFVAVLQEIMMLWRGGLPMVKAGIIFLLSIIISIGISYLIKRFPRGFVAFLIALFVLASVITL